MVDRMRRRVHRAAGGPASSATRPAGALRPARPQTPPSSARCCATPRRPSPQPACPQRRPTSSSTRPSRTTDAHRLLPARGAALDARNADPELRGHGRRARHGARARRLHPDGPGHHRRGQRGAQPRARRRLPEDGRQGRRHRRASATCSPTDARARQARSQYVSKRAGLRAGAQAQPRGLRACWAPTRCPTPSASRPTTRTTSLQLRDALAPATPGGGRTTIDPAIDDGQEPQRRDEEDPRRHARDEADDRRCSPRCSSLASILLISNTIRLSLFSRRREVEVMKLVGATDWFIRWPFVIEGVILGALGGVLAILLLAVGKIALLDPLAQRLRAARGAADDRLRAAGRRAAGRQRRGVAPRARACRCAASCASERRSLRGARTVRRSHARRARPACRHRARRAAAPVLLVLGIWLGGHPEALPGFAARRRSSATRTRASSTRRSTTIHARLLPQGPARTSSPTTRSPASSRRSTTASRPTSRPKDYRRFQRAPAQRVLAASASRSCAGPARAARRTTSSTARRPSAPACARGDVIVAVDGRSLARPRRRRSGRARSRARPAPTSRLDRRSATASASR